MGEAQVESPERKLTRTTQIVEVELSSPIKFERKPKPAPVQTSDLQSRLVEKTEDTQIWGNRGFMTPGAVGEVAGAANVEKYTVQKNDTLQKISQKFYGTTKKWAKIYEANKDTLKGPNKIYPGQVLDIPVEFLKEPSENLK
ncbi:MAG: LysM peptidoglycan-binding domain-containing protein [Candidatus Omnitrophica bacterium]|nr:LysM peptidoglycan-binding domain-containing protein [Candidatus Omnitrophota bacterium]